MPLARRAAVLLCLVLACGVGGCAYLPRQPPVSAPEEAPTATPEPTRTPRELPLPKASPGRVSDERLVQALVSDWRDTGDPPRGVSFRVAGRPDCGLVRCGTAAQAGGTRWLGGLHEAARVRRALDPHARGAQIRYRSPQGHLVRAYLVAADDRMLRALAGDLADSPRETRYRGTTNFVSRFPQDETGDFPVVATSYTIQADRGNYGPHWVKEIRLGPYLLQIRVTPGWNVATDARREMTLPDVDLIAGYAVDRALEVLFPDPGPTPVPQPPSPEPTPTPSERLWVPAGLAP